MVLLFVKMTGCFGGAFKIVEMLETMYLFLNKRKKKSSEKKEGYVFSESGCHRDKNIKKGSADNQEILKFNNVIYCIIAALKTVIFTDNK